MTGEGTIRTPVAADAPAIARVHIDTWRETYSGHMTDSYFDEDSYRRRLEMWTHVLGPQGRPGARVVAERDGEIVGFATAGSSDSNDARNGHEPVRDLHLYAVYLLAREHGRGLGQQMVDAVVGSQPAQLWVMRGNDRAIAFYRRNGFEFDGVEVARDDLGVVELRMVR